MKHEEFEKLVNEAEALEGEDFEEYYKKHIFPEVTRIFCEKCEKQGITGRYRGVILTVGNSPEPLILTINGLKPERAHFICTRESERHLDRIVEETKLAPSRYTKDEVNKSDGVDVYKSVRKTVQNWDYHNGEIAADITGGTKAMVAGCSLAANTLGIDVLYVKSQYWKGKSKPKPASEELIQLKNPLEVFYEIEERKAEELMAHHNYEAAKNIYWHIAKNVESPRLFEAKAQLAEALQEWDAFNYTEAFKLISRAEEMNTQFNLNLPNLKPAITALHTLSQLNENQQSFTEFIKDPENASLLAADLLNNSQRRAKQGRYDDAIIRLYRALELLAQHLLLHRHNIDTGNITTEKLGKYQQTFKATTKQLHGGERSIPQKTGLLDSWILLYALGENITLQELTEMNNQITTRNLLMIEHRNQRGNKKAYEKFKKYTQQTTEKHFPNIQQHLQQTKHPTPTTPH
jgi:CRISPR-associated protein (TIGR02710 family)